MILSESLKIIDKLEGVFATFKPSLEGREEWTAELQDTLAGYTCDEVWPLIRSVCREECYKFPPTPYDLLGKVRYKIYNATRDQRRDDQKLLEQADEPQLSLEEIKANVARVAGMVAAATPGEEEKPDIYKKAVSQSSDDLSPDKG